MTILRRATDVLTANIHEWIDRCEDPERMLKQLVRELEEATDLAMDATAKAIANERLLERQLAALRQHNERLQERARAAVVRGDDNAARAAVAARQRHQTFLDTCESQHDLASRESAKFRQELNVLRLRLNEARQTMQLYAARQRIALSRQTLANCSHSGFRGQATCGRFDRICERIDRADAESAALLELLEETDVHAELQFEETVNRELEALKEAVAGAAGS